MKNTGGNTRGSLVTLSQQDHDEAMAQLSPEFKQFVADNDVGGFNAVQLLELVRTYGEAKARLAVLITKNHFVYETYGKSHPDFNPRLPYRRQK